MVFVFPSNCSFLGMENLSAHGKWRMNSLFCLNSLFFLWSYAWLLLYLLDCFNLSCWVFSHLFFLFSPHLTILVGEWARGCVGFSCRLGLNHSNLDLTLFQQRSKICIVIFPFSPSLFQIKTAYFSAHRNTVSFPEERGSRSLGLFCSLYPPTLLQNNRLWIWTYRNVLPLTRK